MSTPMYEQETTVTAGRSEKYVDIYTTNSVHLKKLRSDSRVAEIRGGEDWGQFRIPAPMYDPITGFKRARKPMTEEQKVQASERLEKARASRGPRA